MKLSCFVMIKQVMLWSISYSSKKYSFTEFFMIILGLNEQVSRYKIFYIYHNDNVLLLFDSEEVSKLKNEVKAQKLLLLAEKDTVFSLERKQYDIESQREKSRALYLKEKLKVEELRAKYEPGKYC